MCRQIEFETSFGLVATSESALVEAIRELLLEHRAATADDLPEAVNQ